MWQKHLQPYIDRGFVVAIGVVQEQHPDRAKLYKQWRQLGWTIFVDSLNVLDHKVVPIPMGLSINGHVQFPRLTRGNLKAFLDKDERLVDTPRPRAPHAMKGDEYFYANKPGSLDRAIASYGKQKDNRRARFRLGVALRRRADSAARKPGDAQAAATAWTQALAADPNQYIWRRRLQQYGPLLAKPYNFYGWVKQARADIKARGETPIALNPEPRGSELMQRGGKVDAPPANKDPQGRIARDPGFVAVDTVVTPARVRPGHVARVRMVITIDKAFWNNEADPLTLFVDRAGVEGVFVHQNPKPASTRETRVLEFDVPIPADEKRKSIAVLGYVLFNLCEKEGGVCRLLRLDVGVMIKVDKNAPAIMR